MIIAATLRALLRRRSRTALALAGIAVSAALLLNMTMLASGLTSSFGELTRAQGYGLRVTPLGTLPFDSEAGIADAAAVETRIRSVTGVSAVAPVLGAQLYVVPEAGPSNPIFSTGVDPDAQMLYLLLRGREPEGNQIVVSESLAADFELDVGDEVALAAELDVTLGRPRSTERFQVSGIADFLYSYAGERSIALPLPVLQRLTGRADEVSLFAVAASESADEARVADRVEAATENLSVYSTRELMSAMDERLVYFRQLSTILGTIALGVATLLVATIITIGVRERFGEIATLRAIGVAGYRLQLAIVAEGVVLTSIGCLIGVPIGFWMASRLDRILLSFPGIPARVSFFVFDPVPVGLAMAATVGIGALAGAVPGARALRTPLGRALREEAD